MVATIVLRTTAIHKVNVRKQLAQGIVCFTVIQTNETLFNENGLAQIIFYLKSKITHLL